MELRDRLAAIAAEHKVRQEALAGAIPEERALAIKEQAADHAAQQFANALEAGVPEDVAMESALAEADRCEAHLRDAAVLAADPNVEQVTRPCASCQAETSQAVVTDHNGERVATCLCGRFTKFAAGESLA